MTDYLCQHLSPAVTAYLSGHNEPEAVQAWARGDLLPGPEESARLEVAFEASKCLVPVCGDEMTRSWFFGMNQSLRDTAPAYVLRHWSPDNWDSVLAAAQAFSEI